MRWPEEREYTIKSLGSASAYYNGEVKGVELLGYGAVSFTNSPEGLVVTLPQENTNAIAPVLAVSF
jgi:alpha-L-fucosidase